MRDGVWTVYVACTIPQSMHSTHAYMNHFIHQGFLKGEADHVGVLLINHPAPLFEKLSLDSGNIDIAAILQDRYLILVTVELIHKPHHLQQHLFDREGKTMGHGQRTVS